MNDFLGSTYRFPTTWVDLSGSLYTYLTGLEPLTTGLTPDLVITLDTVIMRSGNFFGKLSP